MGAELLLVANQDPVTKALREAACRQHADLIVVGASAGRWHRLLNDHVGAALARTAPAPTLIVH
jgi:nucleotide-binding universal stress UspA family protein